MRVLVDTSVWVRFLAGKAPYASGLDRLLAREAVCGHPFVYGELLMGDTGGRRALLENYRALPMLSAVGDDEVAELVTFRRLAGRGLGWVDAHLLASAAVHAAKVWTADARFAAAASALRLDYAP